MSHNGKTNAVDLRVRRTQKMLQEAFIELVVEAGFEAITVQMLSERAMINRATFYRHYNDKFDLAEKVYIHLTNEHMATVVAEAPQSPLDGWRLLFEHCGRYAEFYLALLSGMPRFQEQVRDGIEQQTYAILKTAGLDDAKTTLPLPVILRYLALAQMGLVQWWLEEGQPVSATEMAGYLWELHQRGPFYHFQLPS